ncbi:hypothetical protein [Paenibacillus polymyxa]|uniref:hypothetical protein n=1 Tax=Paenibacillus polymyxa TaxID=1406 RepID=UPI00237956C6|nr:hypothetical protein [Paenibacillus polymyxa]WDM23499.1 hypothetical protein J4I02_08315 [Paenibacillus polymyxa]
MRDAVSFLASGQTLITLVGTFFELENKEGNLPIYEVKIDYEDIDSNVYQRIYLIHSNVYNGTSHAVILSVHELTNEAKKIEKHF